LELRYGQANNALHAIRIGISHKAGLFRGKVRAASSQQTRTRAWDAVISSEANIQYQAKIYSRARYAMVQLDAPSEMLEKYKILRKHDLVARTSVLNPNIQRHQNEQLAWFWKMDVSAGIDEDKWMQECECAEQFWKQALTIQYIGSIGSAPNPLPTVGKKSSSSFRMR